jgi:DNA modification methylase
MWEIALDPNVGGGHATQKPVEAMERPIRNHDAAAVYDPFLGSGTTLIACERAGRQSFAMEIDPRYVDVSVSRWEKFTGGTAHLA